MSLVNIPHIEWHIAHSCNLTCYGCGHFSNHAHKGIVKYEELESWYKSWSNKILPENISLLGGEPLLNKDIYRILDLTSKYWARQETTIDLVTNGFLLYKYPELPKYLVDNNIQLHISKHSNDPQYLEKFNSAWNIAKSWEEQYGITLVLVPSDEYWMQIYKGYGNNMLPFEDNDPEESWNNCVTGQDCFQIYNNKVYKCSPLAYLQIQKQLYNLSEKWDHYLQYKPLEPTATQEEVKEFFSRKAESYCSMCPKNPKLIEHKNPMVPRSQYEKEIIKVIND